MSPESEEIARRARGKRYAETVGQPLWSSPAAIQRTKRLKTGRISVVTDFGPPTPSPPAPAPPTPSPSPPKPAPRQVKPTSRSVQPRRVSYGRPRALFRTEGPPQQTRGHTYRCPSDGCGHSYSSGGELASHQLREHPEAFRHIEWRACTRLGCDFMTKSGHDFAIHSTSHSAANEAPAVAGVQVAAGVGFQCTISGCNTICATFVKLQAHSIEHNCQFSGHNFPGFKA